ncbi:hypothetical protein PoB_003126500 [Plakobranchus ocellatus]|uniref:Uncharacterized protein n=1 Tax=Plakobranchus ocellatus TaxID=259542 RepID=A0AAV4ABL6_9GAST|nr:hypothetical protein PoB_003126500 [Plakobranchus ocellatus]
MKSIIYCFCLSLVQFHQQSTVVFTVALTVSNDSLGKEYWASMGRAVLLLLLVITIDVVVSEDFLSRFRREMHPQQNPHYACRSSLEQCYEQSLSSYEIEEFEMLQPMLANRTLMTQLGLDLQVLADCMEDVAATAQCQSIQKSIAEEIAVINFIAGYMNSSESIDKIVAASSSVCITEEEKIDQVFYALMGCAAFMERAIRLEADICVSFSQLWQCATTHVSQICGQTAGDFIDSVREYALSPDNVDHYLQYLSTWSGLDLTSCSNQLILARRYVRAALPLIKQIRK